MKKAAWLMPFLVLVSCNIIKDKVADKTADLFKEPDISKIREGFKAAIPLAYAADVAMKTMDGVSLPGVTVISGLPGTGAGSFVVHIAGHDSMPLPSGVPSGGKVIVGGVLNNDGVSLMSVVFTDLTFGSGSFSIQDASTFMVQRKTDAITGEEQTAIAFAALDLNAGSGSLVTADVGSDDWNAEWTRFETMSSFDSTVALEELAWGVTIDDNETPAAVGDDVYTVYGGGQFIEVNTGGTASAGLVQLTVIGAEVTPACLRNPRAGWALMQELDVATGGDGSSEFGHVLLTFDAVCDGTVKVAAATGSYTASWGEHIPLDLDN